MNIREICKKNSDTFIKVALYLFSLIFMTVLVSFLNIPPVNDEVATLASPEYLLGNDWSETLYSIGGYYFKYGAGMIYLPLMLIFKNPYVLYKAMLILNCAINAFTPVIAYTIFKKHLGANRTASGLIALSTVVYPATVLFTMYTRADSLLLFLPWPITLILLELLKISFDIPNGDKKRLKRRRVILSLVLAALCIYSYAVHTRGIVILLAVVVSCLIAFLVLRVRFIAVIPFSLVCAGLLLVDKALSGFFYDRLYSYYGTSFSSVESYNFSALSDIFTAEGFKAFIKETLGTLFNVCVSSYGLVIIAVILGTVLLVRYLRNKREATPAWVLFTLFTLVLFVGTFMMSIIYFFPYVYDYYTGVSVIRSDWLVYGRYIACSSSGAVALGLYLLFRDTGRRAIVTKTLSLFIYAGVCAAFLKFCAPFMEGVSSVSRNFIQLCTFAQFQGEGLTTGIIGNISEALLWAALTGGAVFVILLVLSVVRKDKPFVKLITLCFIVASVIIAMVNYDKARLARDEKLYQWVSTPVEILLQNGDLSEYPIYVDDSAKDIKHYQYVCAKYTCCSSLTDSSGAEEMFIISRKKNFPRELYNDDYYILGAFDYEGAVHDILFVKGHELAGKLKDRGYEVSLYTGKLKK